MALNFVYIRYNFYRSRQSTKCVLVLISFLASSADSSDSESAKDKTVKENETGELTKEVLSELKMEEKPLLTGIL